MKTPLAGDTRRGASEESLNLSRCGVCSGEVTDECEALTCDKCAQWHHKSCGKLTDRQYNKILNAPRQKPIEWICQNCKKTSKQALTHLRGTSDGDNHTSDSLNNRLSGNTKDINGQGVQNDLDLSMTGADLVTVPRETLTALYSDLEQANQELVRAKQEIIKLNQEAITKTHTIIRLNQTLRAQHLTTPDQTNYKTLKVNLKQNLTQGDNIMNNRDEEADSEVDTLIIGDSIIKGLKDYIAPGQINNTPKIQILSSPGATIQHFSKYISNQRDIGLPQTVIVHVGTNNVVNSRTPNHVMRPLWYTIESAQKTHKNTIWVVNGILHRRDVSTAYINDINDALRFMCDQLKIVYRDPNTMVTARGLGRDGLHLNAYGAQRLAEFIFSDIGILTSSLPQELSPPTKEPGAVTATTKSTNVQHTDGETKNEKNLLEEIPIKVH